MSRTKLVFGYEPDFAPLTFADENGACGLIIDLLAQAFRGFGSTIDFVPVGLPRHEAALFAGEVDGLAFKAIIRERAGDFDFSAPLIDSGAAWFVLPGGPPGEDHPPAHARLATPAKGPLIAQLRVDFPGSDFVAVETYAEALGSVAEGKADRAALNFHIGCYLARRDFPGRFELPVAPFHSLPIGFAVAKGTHADTLDKFNRALLEMWAAGGVAEIERRWLEP